MEAVEALQEDKKKSNDAVKDNSEAIDELADAAKALLKKSSYSSSDDKDEDSHTIYQDHPRHPQHDSYSRSIWSSSTTSWSIRREVELNTNIQQSRLIRTNNRSGRRCLQW